MTKTLKHILNRSELHTIKLTKEQNKEIRKITDRYIRIKVKSNIRKFLKAVKKPFAAFVI